MTETRPKSIPLPVALLALSVAVCLGAAGPVEASTLRSVSASHADQRQSLEHLLEAIQQAAKKLTDRMDGQTALAHAGTARGAVEVFENEMPPAARPVRADHFLREALLNLPPPSC